MFPCSFIYRGDANTGRHVDVWLVNEWVSRWWTALLGPLVALWSTVQHFGWILSEADDISLMLRLPYLLTGCISTLCRWMAAMIVECLYFFCRISLSEDLPLRFILFTNVWSTQIVFKAAVATSKMFWVDLWGPNPGVVPKIKPRKEFKEVC